MSFSATVYGDDGSSASATITVSGGGLPTGVTIQQIDGGPSYFAKWANGFPTSPSFFPICVFDQTLGYGSGSWDPTQLAAYKAVGINTFVGLYNGWNASMATAIKAAGMYVIAGPLAPTFTNTQVGYVWFDEADGNNCCGEIPGSSVLGTTVACTPTSDGRTPATAIAGVTAALHAKDPTRFVYGQYTKPVCILQGLSVTQASAYCAAVDVISFDYYVITDSYNPAPLWQQYTNVSNVRSYSGYAKPVFPFLECCVPFEASQWSGVTPTPAMCVAEAWHAIIGGARAIQWFDHDFGGSSGGYESCSDVLINTDAAWKPMQAAVGAFNARVTLLAPAINSPFAVGYVTATGAVNVMAKYDGTSFWIFAAAKTTSTQTVTFTIAGGYSGPVVVQGESRTLTAANGVFSDSFAGQTAVHVYQVP